ncbi:MAG: UDP-N-acetylmuramoyl-L-alanine--D-glutamate ligase [Pseudomonadota bacterium]|nr:UDP-N-acetylmuramoyl-L-alanine--D-glutamate ligase [Pseudomonadota bacterium]
MNMQAEPKKNELPGKHVLVVGLGVSGVAVARFLCRQGALVSVSDNRSENLLAEAVSQFKLLSLSELETGGHTVSLFLKQDMIVVSPGVPSSLEVLEQARARDIPVIGEIELASRFIQMPLIVLTGTNGKTTTVTLLGEIFKAAGRKAFVGGNIGTPAVDMLLPDAGWELGILELSSFQLEGMVDFRPRVAVILNVTPDHQDRYADEDAYLAAKMSIMKNQQRSDYLLLNIDDQQLEIQYRKLEKRWLNREEISRPLPFSCRTVLNVGGNFLDQTISYRLPAEDGELISGEIMVPSLKVMGEHNRSNVLAAFMVGLIYGLEPEVMISALASFGGLVHRLEYVSRVAGIDYVNDSKATNIDAVAKAIVSFEQPVVLLLGGRDKGARFADLENILGGRVREIIPFGEAAELIARQLPHFCAGVKAANLQEAVVAGSRLAHPGDVVLLSPGCASFDEFSNYKQRGKAFIRMVHKLEGQD